MTSITYQQKCDPVYDDAGYIIGYDSIHDCHVNVASDKVDDYLETLAEDDTVYNVRVYQTIAQERKESGEWTLDPEYWNEPY
jgi:hypothetical protein